MLPLYNGALPAFLYAGQTTKIEAGKRADAMTRARQKQENKEYILNKLSPEDENGKLTHVLCAIRSISDAKKREQDLQYQVTEAKKDAALKTRFLSNMSHDIRTPINGIMGMLELMNQHLIKPLSEEKLVSTLREVL